MPEEVVRDAEAIRKALDEKLQGMSFLSHLEELRKRIIHAAIAVVIAMLGCFAFAEKIFEFMQRPIMKALAANKLDTRLVYTSPTEPFNIYLKVALVAGIFLASPFVLYQVWLFISPGLYRHERKWVWPFMACTILLFVAGGAFGYFVAYPTALEFLIGYGSQFTPMITIAAYTDLFLVIIIALGLIFEMPVLVMFLAMMGLVTPGWMWRNIRYAILVIFVVAAVITPSTDIPNMVVFATPMMGLYVISIGVAWLVNPKRRREKATAKAEA